MREVHRATKLEDGTLSGDERELIELSVLRDRVVDQKPNHRIAQHGERLGPTNAPKNGASERGVENQSDNALESYALLFRTPDGHRDLAGRLGIEPERTPG